jgi:hypothetical protein
MARNLATGCANPPGQPRPAGSNRGRRRGDVPQQADRRNDRLTSDSWQAWLGFEPSLETTRAEGRGLYGVGRRPVARPCAGIAGVGCPGSRKRPEPLAQDVSWGADSRLAARTRQCAQGRDRSRSRHPSIEPQDALALSTLSGLRPMIEIKPLARANELYARMDAEQGSLRHCR